MSRMSTELGTPRQVEDGDRPVVAEPAFEELREIARGSAIQRRFPRTRPEHEIELTVEQPRSQLVELAGGWKARWSCWRTATRHRCQEGGKQARQVSPHHPDEFAPTSSAYSRSRS